MRRFALALFFVSLANGMVTPAHAAKRFALLIGNAGYTRDVGPLRNPHKDVALLAAALSRLGFEVTTVKDATYRTLDVEVRRHAMKLKSAGDGAIGFFYYSGHGVANPETSANYLIPIDVSSVTDKDVWLYAFEQKTVVDRLSSLADNATHFVVFDACRDELETGGARSKSLGSTKGFVPIATQPGLLIAYSTAPGRTASDEGQEGGPYATVLAEEIGKPGVEAVAMFRQVQLEVRRKINQDPWLSFPALPEVYLAGRAPARSASVPFGGPVPTDATSHTPSALAAPSPPMSAAAKAWLVVQQSDNATIIEAFANEFPDSIFAKFARARIRELEAKKSLGNSPSPAAASEQTVKAVQSELKRLNCYGGAIDGDWGPQSRLAMTRLNQAAKTAFDTASASEGSLDLLKAIKQPICPTQKPPARQREERPTSQSRPSRSAGIRRNCRRETRQECKYRVCPQGYGCGYRGTGICRRWRRKLICK